MIRLLIFLRRVFPLVLFVVIEIICLNIFFSQNAYQRARMVALSHYVVGGLNGTISSASSYLSLDDQNVMLLRENAALRHELDQLRRAVGDSVSKQELLPLPQWDTTMSYKIVRVVDNSFTSRNNFITIAGGKANGIVPEMALFNSDGIVGYVKYTSENFAVAVSVLNSRDFRTSGRLSDGSVGSISWDGQYYGEMVMDEIPAHAEIAVGDTVTTTQYSNIFPEGIGIGVVESFEKQHNTLYSAKVRLLADMTRLNYLYAMRPKRHTEREQLQELAEQSQVNETIN